MVMLMSTLVCQAVLCGPIVMWEQPNPMSQEVPMPGVRPRRKVNTHGQTTNGVVEVKQQYLNIVQATVLAQLTIRPFLLPRMMPPM